MASEAIHELRADVDAKNTFILSQEQQFKAFVERSSDDEGHLRKQVEHGRNLLNIESQQHYVREKEFKLQITILELECNNLKTENKLLASHLEMAKSFLQEERETLRTTQEMIYLRTGMKPQVFVGSVDAEKDECKEEKLKHTPTTRSSVKRQLEERASRLLAEQREREAIAETKGDLAPKEKEVAH